jgi:hypothetical protein
MSKFNERPYQTFISHAHADKAVVDKIHCWLTQAAKIKVWYDGDSLPSGTMIGSYLAEAIHQCRGVIIVLSKESVESGWVKEEYNAAVGQRAKNSSFRIIPIRIDECDIPDGLENTKRVEAVGGELKLSVFDDIISGLYYENVNVDFAATRDIYVSRSWRDQEAAPADAVCHQLMNAGFRLIGDSPDQKSFGERRVETIMTGCGGLVAILPDRGGGTTSKYMLEEIELARGLQIPYLVFAQASVNLPEGLAGRAILFQSEDDLGDGKNKAAFSDGIETLREEYRNPERLHHVFLSTSFADEIKERNLVVKRAIERITGLPCIVGESINFSPDSLQQEIARLISRSLMMLADISDEQINTCIETGIAMGAGVRVHLLARGPRRQPPFMFRHMQVEYFDDDTSLLGIIHQLSFPYRRHVLNWEVA